MTAITGTAGLDIIRTTGGWKIVHSSSGLPATGVIRYKRHAEQARTELYATGADFTAELRVFRNDPAAQAVMDVATRWGLRQQSPRSYRIPIQMTFWAIRNSDGTIHVTNSLGGMTGQHHVHDEASWQDWLKPPASSMLRAIDPKDIEWIDNVTDCTCGQAIWRRPGTN